MDTLDPGVVAPSMVADDATSRRKSGRTTQKPVHYEPDMTINGSAKRKRDTAAAQEVDDDIEEDVSSDEGEADEEELKEKRRRSGGRAQGTKQKPANKKPKVGNGDGVSLAMRPAANGVKRNAKPKKSRARRGAAGPEGTGLYAEVFLAGTAPDEVAASWIERYRNNSDEGICELVNFVLKCAGCNLQLTAQDIGDPDNAADKLTELQEEFQAQRITDYPLISRAKNLDFSKEDLENFLGALVSNAHASEVMYKKDDAMISSLQVWISTMSSSPSRPFRHTATLVALCIGSEVCKVIQEISGSMATSTRQKQAEQKKKSVNKGRVTTLDKAIKETEAKNAVAENWIKDIYTTVFVHRYRDIDPKIRVDCINSIGFWIYTCPDLFFEGSTLRYLGWLLSDNYPLVRAEVVKQLNRLYKNEGNVGRLRAFTDKFRPRMVEMANQDAETYLRVSTIGLLDLIRKLGMLDPNDIDVIGRMIFDTDPKIRDKVGSFFAESINDVLEGSVEELGGEEVLNDALGNEVEDDYDSPRKDWLKLKCIAEVIGSYDGEQSEDEQRHAVSDILIAAATESRYSLAANAVCRGVEEAREWQAIAGFLLYDNTSSGSKGRRVDPLENFKKRCQLDEQQERLLLEILEAAVKVNLAEANEQEHDRRKTKKEKNEARGAQEETAVQLASIIPRLLKKFGAQPSTASPVLRLEHLLNLGIFQEMRHDSAEFASLLDDINRQFLTHADQSVLAEASTAILHAREFEDLEEVTETKLQELWDGTISTLRQLTRAKVPRMSSLASTVSRIANLASVSDCTDALELEPRIAPKSKSSTPTKALEILLDLIRGYGTVPDPDADALVSNAMQAVLLYYLWVLKALQDRLQSKSPIEEFPSYEDFTSALVGVIDQRPKLDEIRLRAISILLDLHTSFAALQGIEQSYSTPELAGLIKDVPTKAEQLILTSFIAAEKDFAKKSNRTLDQADDTEFAGAPESEPEEPSDEEEVDADEEVAVQKTQRRKEEALRAESRLLELTSKVVIAIIGHVLGSTGSTRGQLRKRLQQNKVKLGPNFKEVLAYMEGPKPKRPAQKAKPQQAAKQPAQLAKSAEVVADNEDSDDEDEAEGPENEDLDRDPDDELEDNVRADDDQAQAHEEPEDDIMGD